MVRTLRKKQGCGVRSGVAGFLSSRLWKLFSETISCEGKTLKTSLIRTALGADAANRNPLFVTLLLRAE